MEIDSKKPERSYKEQRIREITLMYYSRKEIREALFEFSKNRECVPKYFEVFGKRPDSFQYESDVMEFVKNGATSFHCSEELWEDPLEISTELSREELNELRIGWDLLIDVDSPYFEYSKIYTEILIDVLEFHGIRNFGIKFSGGKGFHIIVPWRAFPKDIYNQKTKDHFPEWPRIICEYLSEIIKPRLEEKILANESLRELARKTGKEEKELIIKECAICHRNANKKFLIIWKCPYCKNEITTTEGLYNNRRKSKCPECRKDLEEKSRKEIYFCEFCNIDSVKNPEAFKEKERLASEKLIDADLVLVAPRHLFRMPYSLHEKTALVSAVIDKNKIKSFDIKDASPFRIEMKDFYPETKENEAKSLLLQALDWKEQKEMRGREHEKEYAVSEVKESGRYKKVLIQNPPDEIFPPCIKLLLQGMGQDGRKRALFILISFFRSLGTSEDELEKRVYSWNERNYRPLKKGYIQSQLKWSRKHELMPSNCSNPIYNNLGVCKPDTLCKKIKNPLNYSIKLYYKNKSKTLK